MIKSPEQEDNDLKAYGLYIKGLREENKENFINNYLPELKKASFIIKNDNDTKFTILNTPYGVIDFFPKANKILLRKVNKWKKNGILWIINNLLNLEQ